MDKLITFGVFFLWLCCSSSATDCSSDLYYKPGHGCVECPPCSPGMERTSNCGHDITGKLTGERCRSCVSGYYKDTNSTERCKQCQNCKDQGKLTTQSCSLTSDTVCECPGGKYKISGYSGRNEFDCAPCSYCCEDNWQQSKNMIQACKEQGLGRCSCKRTGECFTKCPAPTPASTVTKSRTTTLTVQPKTTDAAHQKDSQKSSTLVSKATKPTTIVRRKKTNSPTMQPTITDVEDYITPSGSKRNGVPKAQQQEEKSEAGIFHDPGWIVAFSIVGSIILVMLVLVWRHDGIRKKVSGCCCRNYQQLSRDFTSVLLTVEDRQEEPAVTEPINNATPILPCKQPVPSRASSAEVCARELHCSSDRINEVEEEKLQCACTLASSESSIEWLKSPSSSCEVISGDLQHCSKTSKGGRQTPPGVTSARVTPLNVTQPRVTSPTPSTLLNIAQTIITSDQETSDQSREHCVTIESLGSPSHHQGGVGGENSRPSNKGRDEHSPKTESLGRNCIHDVCKEAKLPVEPDLTAGTGETKQELTPVPASDKGSDRVVMTTGGNDIEVNGNGRVKKKKQQGVGPPECEYRPIIRGTEHRCANCCPQPSDSFFTLIERDRRCLMEEICKKLNRNSDTLGNYKQLAIFSRVDNEIPEFEANSNPAERVLERLKAKRPSLTLKEFEDMLCEIKRLDIVDSIENHHTTCHLCKRNKFD